MVNCHYILYGLHCCAMLLTLLGGVFMIIHRNFLSTVLAAMEALRGDDMVFLEDQRINVPGPDTESESSVRTLRDALFISGAVALAFTVTIFIHLYCFMALILRYDSEHLGKGPGWIGIMHRMQKEVRDLTRSVSGAKSSLSSTATTSTEGSGEEGEEGAEEGSEETSEEKSSEDQEE